MTIVHHHVAQDSVTCKKQILNSSQFKLKKKTGSYDQTKRKQSFSLGGPAPKLV